VLYRNDKKGLVPTLLRKWFDERVEYKRLMKKFGGEGDTEQQGYFKRRQHVQKIILNSLYGVLGLPVFRFYDIDNAEATTVTGQELIKFTQKMANYFYNKELDDKEDYVIYTDTDSIFCSAVPLVEHRNPDADTSDDEYMTKEILSITEEVQDFINGSYDMFAKRFLNVKDEHRFDIKQEVISRSAFWVTKKRYGQWIINDDGVPCDKLDVKGLDIVRSSFPVSFRELMTRILKGILNNTNKEEIDDMILTFKKSLKEQSLDDIALPTGVKGIQKFTDRSRGKFNNKTIFTNVRKGAPVHVKASITYNDLLKYYGLKSIEPIRNSDKIKWVYLKENPLQIKQLAFKGYDDPKEIIDYIEQYIDRDKLFKKALQKKLDMFYESLDWVLVDKQDTLDRFF
jgi:DNA polymerase elongation subunit (family B)